MNTHDIDAPTRQLVAVLGKKYQFNDTQVDQFGVYLRMLQSWNQRMNLTAITNEKKIVSYHFDDSLQLKQCMNLSEISSLADVGAGAGFPALPLKIAFPHLKVVLIEVNQKKINFLHAVIQELGLKDVETSDLDWRTFLRTTDYAMDLFVSRAAVQPAELVRMFKPSCIYRTAQLVYWASQQWLPTGKEAAFMYKEYPYQLDDKQRKLVFFKQ